ncbi:hypothetical protein CDV36_005221 [Fusarium kuroshium]|uniref:Uncharacterized protein n=1 Tax=Fusarium kuroshium TaxID=2010991 RepID=A0A3M2SC16_9HYPO|nr:hypothetical protein CDV36_005221 [Fusarium kuroshium]
MAHMNVAKMPRLPTMRLQVWHRRDFAPTQKDNQDFAHFLGSFDTGSWNPQPAEVSTVPFCSDSLVPIEVDIKYRPTSYYNLPEASAELCLFFRDTVQARVGEFFNGRHTAAVLVNMYPVGDEVTENVKAMLLRAKLLQPLVIQSRTYTGTYRVSNRSMLEEGAILAAKISANALELNGLSTAADLNTLKDKALSLASLLQARSRLGKPGNSTVKGTGVNTPVLYDSLVLIRASIIQLSAYQKSSESIIEQLQKQQDTQTQTSHSVAAGLGSPLCGLLYTMAGLECSPVSMGAVFLLGFLTTGIIGFAPLYKRIINRNEVGKLGAAMEDLQRDLRIAQFGLGILFCNQTLRMPFSWLTDSRGDGILKGLGVDISQIKNEQYSEKFALDSLHSLRGSYDHFEKLRASIGRHAGLKDCIEATMPSNTPDGNGDPMDLQED